MKIKAAVVEEKGQDYVIQEVTMAEPIGKDVLVKMVASGICRSDYTERNGNSVLFPNVLGHEGSGIVEKVGDGVVGLEPGDHVILSYSYCQECQSCIEGRPASCDRWLVMNNSGKNPRGEYTMQMEDGTNLNSFFNQSSFATYTLVDESNIVKVDKDLDLRILGPLGCGLGTGSGAVLSVLKPKPGESIAVFGTGAVGFAAVMSAKIAGCSTIIAMDINEERLEMAKKLGATHVINSQENSETVVEEILALTNGNGVNYSIDTSGVPVVMRQALDVVRSGGTYVPLAVTPHKLEIHTFLDLITRNRKVVGCLIGDTLPKIHLTQLIEFYREGRFPFDQFVKFFDFADLSKAEAASVSGEVLKSVVVIDPTYTPPS